MARTATKKAPGKSKGAAGSKTRKVAKPARARSSGGEKASGPTSSTSSKSAADALIGLLQSPVVADILAAGAAAALAAFTQHSVSRRSEGGSKAGLKRAVKAAAAAMGARISEEFEEIVESAKSNRGEE